MTMTNQSKSQVERANRMFAVEQAVKLGVVEGFAVVDTARDIFSFVNETQVETNPVGFSGGPESEFAK